MSKQIMIQPDGRYAIFNTTIDNFTTINADLEEMEAEIPNAAKIIEALKAGGEPYFNFTLDWKTALMLVGKNCGEEELQKLFDVTR